MEKDNSFIDKIFLKNWIPFVIIAGFGFILYFQTFFFDFSYLDDNVLILGNAHFLSSFSNIIQAFQIDIFNSIKELAAYYRPIFTLSFMIDYHLGSIAPFIYHFTNVALHIMASSLLFIFLKKLEYRKVLAFLFSIIFLVHPVLTQTVAWIPGRNDSLLAVFILSTFIFFIKYLKEEKTNNLVWSLIFFSLALFTKESAIFALPIMFFYLYFISTEKNKENKLPFNKLYFFFWSIGIVGLWIIFRNFALNGSIPITLINMFKSVYFSFPAVIQFMGKIFFPFNLSVLPIMRDTTFLYGIISIIILSIILFFTKIKHWNFILFGILWFFLFLLPSFIRPDPTTIANFIEHRLYVPIIGIFIILLETNFIKKIDFKKRNALIIVGSLILLFSIITLVHSRSFVDRLAFWKNATETSPSFAFNHNNLGAMEYLDGNMDKAEKEFKIALALNPKEPMAHNNLGLVYVNQNKLAEAEAEYQKELEINPNYDNAYYNLGLLYWQEKRSDEAISNWKKTLEINPNFQLPPEILQILQSK